MKRVTREVEILPRQNQFHIISIQRRLADHGFSNARTWPEMLSEHQKWWDHYNHEHHFAHRARQDGRHSPSDVLRGVLGRTYPEEVLSRVLYATQFTRHLDKHGYIRFRNWRFFGEDGLTGEEVSVWVYEDTRHPSNTRRRRSPSIPSPFNEGQSRSPR